MEIPPNILSILSLWYFSVSCWTDRNLITGSLTAHCKHWVEVYYLWFWIPWPVSGGQMESPHTETGGGKEGGDIWSDVSTCVFLCSGLRPPGTRVDGMTCCIYWCACVLVQNEPLFSSWQFWLNCLAELNAFSCFDCCNQKSAWCFFSSSVRHVFHERSRLQTLADPPFDRFDSGSGVGDSRGCGCYRGRVWDEETGSCGSAR